MTDALTRFGWDAGWVAAWAAGAPPGAEPGRVVLEHNHVFRVATATGDVLAETAGRLKHRAEGRHALPAVGDWVAVRPDPRGGRALIRAVLPRRTAFTRKAAGRETEQQVVAANVDTVFVVFGLDKPVNPRAIERYLAVAEQSGAEPVVLLNKMDAAGDLPAALAEAKASAGRAPVLVLSARDALGIEQLEPWLTPGRTVALLGPSGAGKSSIVNRLVGGERLAVGDVRESDLRGRHTSVHRQLLVRDAGGLVIDTPGMRELALWDADAQGGPVFDDIAALASACRFRDCRHVHEPGCAVKIAVEDGRLAPGRYDSFLKLQQEQVAVEAQRDERAQIEAKRRGRILGKAIKDMQKRRGR